MSAFDVFTCLSRRPEAQTRVLANEEGARMFINLRWLGVSSLLLSLLPQVRFSNQRTTHSGHSTVRVKMAFTNTRKRKKTADSESEDLESGKIEEFKGDKRTVRSRSCALGFLQLTDELVEDGNRHERATPTPVPARPSSRA